MEEYDPWPVYPCEVRLMSPHGLFGFVVWAGEEDAAYICARVLLVLAERQQSE